MMRGLALTALWLLAGAALAGALYWTLVNTPDSNALMLAGSALLALAILAVGAVTVGGAVRLTQDGGWSSGIPRAGLSAFPWFVLSLVPLALIIWLAGRADAWLMSKSGEISAWFIARFGWADVSWLMNGAHLVLAWLQWIVGPWLGLTLLAAALDRTRDIPLARRWIARACRWRSLALATLWFLLLLALPWQLALWRPGGLPPTWVEPALAAARLLVVGLAMASGVALIIRAAAAVDR